MEAGHTSFSKGLGRSILGHPRRLFTQLLHLLESGLVPFLFGVRTSGSRGEVYSHSRGGYNNALDRRPFVAEN